jgi:hypothetical protein
MKILDDTLKNPDGKYSRKSLTSFVCLGVAIVLAIIDTLHCCEVNIEIFFAFLGSAVGTLGMTIYDKMKNKAQ